MRFGLLRGNAAPRRVRYRGRWYGRAQRTWRAAASAVRNAASSGSSVGPGVAVGAAQYDAVNARPAQVLSCIGPFPCKLCATRTPLPVLGG